MPSRPSICQPFFKSNRLPPHFPPIFPIFGMNVHNNIGQKVVQVEFDFLASSFSNGSLITNNR